MLGERCERVPQLLRAVDVLFEDVVFPEDVECRQRGTAGERVAGVGMRMQEAARRGVVIEGAVDGVGGEHDGERQVAARNAFREANEVGTDIRLVVREEGAGTSAADGDLVADEMHVVAVAERARQA